MNFHKLAVITAVISLCTIVHIFGLERVAVVPFAAGEGVSPFIGSDASRKFMSALESSEQYDLVGESDIFAALESLSMQNVSLIDETAAAQIGKNVNADKIFIGQVSSEVGKMRLTVKCLDTQSGEVLVSKTALVPQSEASISAYCRVMAKQIAKGDTNLGIMPDNLTERQQLHVERLMNHGADITNGNDMKYWFHYYLRMGIAGAITDAVLTTVASGLMAVGAGVFTTYRSINSHFFVFVGISGAIFGIDWIVAPILMVIGFVRMGRTYAIYRKTTGNKKFNPAVQISFGGGYDWKDKETTVSMAIKL